MMRCNVILCRFAAALVLTATSWLCPAAWSGEPPVGFVSMASAFNGWNPADSGGRLTRAGDREELVRFWPAGVHEFKFAFDGSWDKHWGAGAGGALLQPGENIRLIVPQSGTYAVWLSRESRRWGLERRSPARPHAVILAPNAEIGPASLMLDAGLSEPRAGKTLARYTWSITPADAGALLKPRDPSGRTATLTIVRAGRYEVTLVVDDGMPSETARMALELGTGWVLTPGAGRHTAARPMLPLADGSWIAAWRPDAETKELAPTVYAPLGDASRPPAASYDTSRGNLDRNATGWVRFDPVAKEVSLRETNCRPFAFSSHDPRLPRGLVVEHVDLVGDFCNWQPGAMPMLVDAENPSRFVRIVELPDGVYHYKFLINHSIYLDDPAETPSLRQRDERGGFNSGVRIGDDAAAFGPARPNALACAAVRFSEDWPEWFRPLTSNLADVNVRTLAKDAQHVGLVLAGGSAIDLRRAALRDGFEYWSGRVAFDRPGQAYTIEARDGLARCRIVVDDANAPAHEPAEVKHMRHARAKPVFETPDWAKRAVWYQIFPERFRNGSKENDPPSTVPWQHAWFKPYQLAKRGKDDGSAAHKSGYRETGGFYHYIFDRRYGGDIQGIQEKLGHLRDLGITAIYLNPVFQAESLHKYDTADYRHIDDSFGVRDSRLKLKGETTDPKTWQWSESDRVFLDFVKEAHRQGFKVVLDGVFNHVGREHFAFQDVLKRGKKSKFADWIDVKSWEPFHYYGWFGEDNALPRLKHDDALGLAAPVREHIFAITRRWMDPNGDGDPSDGIDGWRLDVAPDINAHFWRDWRKLVKSINPQAHIIAEIWTQAQDMLRGDQFDAVMNYEFAKASQRFFVNKKKATTPAQFGKELETMLSWYAPQVNLVLQNLFDSHDTDRIASMLLNPDLEYDAANRLQDNGKNYNAARPTPACYDRIRPMVAFQMTFLGAPMVWYGDEVGMFGADDPTCRKPMLWPDLMPYVDSDERIMPEMLEHYRRMIAIRNTYRALQLGDYRTLLADDEHGVFAFARSLNDETVVVVLNNSDAVHRLNVPVPWNAKARIVRVDDEKSAELVLPTASDRTGRPRIRPIAGRKSSVRVENGRLQGAMLAPHSAAVFVRE